MMVTKVIKRKPVSAVHREAFLSGMWYFARWWFVESRDAERTGVWAQARRVCRMIDCEMQDASYGKMRHDISDLQERTQYLR